MVCSSWMFIGLLHDSEDFQLVTSQKSLPRSTHITTGLDQRSLKHHTISIPFLPSNLHTWNHTTLYETMSELRSLPKGTKPPGNVYYFRRFPCAWDVLIGAGGIFSCLCLSDSDISLAAKITAWSACLLVLVIFGTIDPECTTEKQVLDETGCEVTLRRPIVGWKSTERCLFLDELASGNFDRDHGFEDERFRDVSCLLIVSLSWDGADHW
jgi:hypothetical protein